MSTQFHLISDSTDALIATIGLEDSSAIEGTSYRLEKVETLYRVECFSQSHDDWQPVRETEYTYGAAVDAVTYQLRFDKRNGNPGRYAYRIKSV